MEILKGTGLELKELCDEKGAAFIDSQVSRLSERYDRIRDGNRKCLQSLQEAVYNSNDEVDQLLLCFCFQVNSHTIAVFVRLLHCHDIVDTITVVVIMLSIR